MRPEIAPVKTTGSPEEIFARFEQAFAQPVPLQIEEVLPNSEAANYRDVLIELIRIELELSFAAGKSRKLSDYFRRFPRIEDKCKMVPGLAEKGEPRFIPNCETKYNSSSRPSRERTRHRGC